MDLINYFIHYKFRFSDLKKGLITALAILLISNSLLVTSPITSVANPPCPLADLISCCVEKLSHPQGAPVNSPLITRWCLFSLFLCSTPLREEGSRRLLVQSEALYLSLSPFSFYFLWSLNTPSFFYILRSLFSLAPPCPQPPAPTDLPPSPFSKTPSCILATAPCCYPLSFPSLPVFFKRKKLVQTCCFHFQTVNSFTSCGLASVSYWN